MQHLRASGVSFVLGADDDGRPVVLHWGAEIGEEVAVALGDTQAGAQLQSGLGGRRGPSLAASGVDVWSGTPAFEWHSESVLPTAFHGAGMTRAGDTLHIELHETRTNSRVRLQYRMHDCGVLEASGSVTNDGSAPLMVQALRQVVPLPDRAREVLDFTGWWSDERRMQRHPVQDGTWRRTNRRGRTGHDSVTLTCVGTTGFRYRTGEIWATHLAWSGDGEVIVERLPEGAGPGGAVLASGELLAPGEVVLAPGESYSTPVTYLTYSSCGLDGVAERMHRLVRSFRAHPTTPRPLLLNSWEAVYFNHDLGRLQALVAAAAEAGVERFVLDDGWFLHRRDDTAGLGDWVVDPDVWPDGLTPLSDAVHEAGMQFGLWFEPEMVNPDSDLARAHPEWILADETGGNSLWRYQQVLNLGNPKCWQHVFDQVSAVIGGAGVDYVKWDHNRDLHEAVDRRTGKGGVHAQTLAFYRMLAALHEAHPGLEIESCASGGGRVDLGVLQHTQRVWASDTIDPLERQRIQLGTELLVPLEEMGSHVGATRSHTTNRLTSLQFRMATALFGHAGIEWDLTDRSDAELQAVIAWIALYKQQRHLLHTGVLVHGDDVPDGALLRGVVSQDQSAALFQLAQLETGRRGANPRTPLPGLDPNKTYLVRLREEFGPAARRSERDPSWIADADSTGTRLPGALLTQIGVPLPALQPQAAVLIEATAVS